jgi:hypothetical protein
VVAAAVGLEGALLPATAPQARSQSLGSDVGQSVDACAEPWPTPQLPWIAGLRSSHWACSGGAADRCVCEHWRLKLSAR